jgi:hypothetical protein
MSAKQGKNMKEGEQLAGAKQTTDTNNVDDNSENKDLLTSRSEHSTVPHARMVNNGQKLDLSPYCKVGLIDSISRLTSISWALKTILRPAGKIMWRSLFLDDAATNVQALFAALSTNTPINEIPLQKKVTAKNTQSNGIVPSDIDTEKRSWSVRIFQFIFIGIPLAIFVGLVYGICNFLQSIVTNLLTVFRTVQLLFTQLQEDATYYQAHPDELPPRKKMIEAVSVQVVSPYISRLVSKKIPLIGSRIAPSFERKFGQTVSRRVNSIYDFVERKAKKVSPNKDTL